MKEKVFEKQSDRTREIDTLKRFCDSKGLNFKVQQPLRPVDASIYQNENFVCFAEVKTMSLLFRDVNQIRISLRKLANIQKWTLEREAKCCIIYRFMDCIGYFWLQDIKDSALQWGGMRNPRKGSLYDRELLVYIPKEIVRMI